MHLVGFINEFNENEWNKQFQDAILSYHIKKSNQHTVATDWKEWRRTSVFKEEEEEKEI
jgi:uncharacterized protein YjlB